MSSQELQEARELIIEQNKVLEKIKKSPLIVQTIESTDGKFVFVKEGENLIRIENLDKDPVQKGDQVLLFKETMQIVEKMPKKPLDASAFSPATIPDIAWKDIGGLEDAKADMYEAIELPHKNREILEFYKKKPSKGILLYGPPGCGKTMLGKAAANSLAKVYGKKAVKSAFLYVKGPEILNPYVGVAEQTIRQIFEDARKHMTEHGFPAIVFIDEADAILGNRGRKGSISGMEKTIVPMFLTEMDGLEDSAAIVILATNRADTLDPAIVRDGRIDRKIRVTRPTKEAALQIVKMNLKDVPINKKTDMTEKDFAELIVDEIFEAKNGKVKMREMLNGAMLVSCVDKAVSIALRRDMLAERRVGLIREDAKEAVLSIMAQNTDFMSGEEEFEDKKVIRLGT